ncbi:Hypothetical predicted protein [Mytilus galloprovincialis]|uniref:Uncharacterized protein n=1 Tax=Mytilus galloprovincialis TaxID=29158 RepID=A0A8B6CNN7_MYTGA|nr:Hypothetical predicted protein [Mytilus galloprovincialis]
MAENRIPTVNLSNNETMSVIDIPVPTFLPSEEDFQQLKIRMAVMVERVISKYLVKYKDDKEAAFTPIQHEEWEKSTRKSKSINIGVIDKNPSSTHGVVKILDKLHAYVSSSEERRKSVPAHIVGRCPVV